MYIVTQVLVFSWLLLCKYWGLLCKPKEERELNPGIKKGRIEEEPMKKEKNRREQGVEDEQRKITESIEKRQRVSR
jgi:hypothetical protein